MIYDHHKRGVAVQLTRIQHESVGNCLSALHYHLDNDHCLELIAVRGRAADLTSLADRLRGVMGVTFARLTMTRLMNEEEHA